MAVGKPPYMAVGLLSSGGQYYVVLDSGACQISGGRESVFVVIAKAIPGWLP